MPTIPPADTDRNTISIERDGVVIEIERDPISISGPRDPSEEDYV